MTFFVQGESYLLSVSSPLGLTIVQALGPSRTEATPLAALIKHQLSAYKVENFSVTHILTDEDRGLRKVADEILALGVRLDANSAGEHVPTVEAKIRVVKERTRAVLASVPYKLPSFPLKRAVMYSVMRLNCLPNAQRANPTPPIKAYRGSKLDFTRDLRVAFGDYATVKLRRLM